MNLPKEITPDNIKDSIIEFRINYSLPYESVLGILLKDILKNKIYENVSSNNELNIPKIGSRNYLFYNENIKFQLSPNSLVINCFREYITWKKFFPEIKKIIALLSSVDSDIYLNRIGLRYVSEYVNNDLSKILNFKFSFSQNDIKSNRFSFSSEFDFEGSSVILSLKNQMPYNNTENKLSHIDIDVSKRDVKISILNENLLLDYLQEIHIQEKKIFFGLLKKEHLQSLNPKY